MADVPTQLPQATDQETLRDRFAMAVLSSPRISGSVSEIAEYCYKIADAMMRERAHNDQR